MSRFVVASLIACLAAAVAGAVVTGLFWLTLVALAVGLVMGAFAVSLRRPQADEELEPAVGGADVRTIRPHRRPTHGQTSSRAA